ncbi:hemolysin family protein [Gangjinia marincola]|uniref:Hemolysin family protein n=1 Tax=Gangjinia marincola TaxID=578463 RepID=A0ABP3XVX5_9FLAO
MTTAILIIIASLLFSAFFSGMEIAYVSANKIHIEIEKKKDDFLAKILQKITKKPSKFIATMLVGNNIALVVYGFYMGDVLMHWLSGIETSSVIIEYVIRDLSLLTQTIISTIVILLTAEFLPKVFFQVYSNTLVKVFALPAYFFYVLFGLISSFVIWISDVVLKVLFKTKGDDVQLSFSKVELGNYITEQMQTVEETDEVDSEIQIFQNALEFSELKSREVMIPRTEIVAVDIHTPPDELTQKFIETGLSKILIFKESNDDIIGYIHAFEMFNRPQKLGKILLPVVFVPETMLIKDVLDVLTKKRKSIAVVVDEYGGTSGMMTVEDIVEELFGEIEDEHDAVVLIEEKLADDHYRFSARLEVDYINETYKLDLPESEHYETLGGMIVDHTEEIPQQGEQVNIQEIRIKIEEVSNTKIELVTVRIPEADQ